MLESIKKTRVVALLVVRSSQIGELRSSCHGNMDLHFPWSWTADLECLCQQDLHL